MNSKLHFKAYNNFHKNQTKSYTHMITPQTDIPLVVI